MVDGWGCYAKKMERFSRSSVWNRVLVMIVEIRCTPLEVLLSCHSCHCVSQEIFQLLNTVARLDAALLRQVRRGSLFCMIL